ncbi:ADP-glyceromanno-heptose 6-epimerase [Peredibacter sp. HCB2-198]|uniref:ADP-glyceromanno-heptose 6-epimerase n=1 Tax=Peredibacter sp. HCB2-198 TaxID=3383025 RepID=UPI0038B62EA7
MILVTGAAGFIGSVIVKELNALGIEDLLLCDHFETGDKWKNLRGLKYDSFVQVEDLFNHPIWKKQGGLKAIYHMGACSATTELDMDFLYKNNTEYTNKLLSLATTKNIPIVYASSAATYGAGEQGYSDDHKGIAKLVPLNKYGYSKQLSDEWILKQTKKPKVWFGVKFFNVFGPNEYHKGKMSSVVFQSFNQIKDVGEVKLFKSHRPDYKDGEQLRDFVYVKDVVRAMIALIDAGKKKPSISGIYNLGTGEARSFHDLVKATYAAMDIAPKITFIDMPVELRNQYQYYTQADMGKLKKALPKFKFMKLEEAVDDYVRNHLAQENPYLSV